MGLSIRMEFAENIKTQVVVRKDFSFSPWAVQILTPSPQYLPEPQTRVSLVFSIVMQFQLCFCRA